MKVVKTISLDYELVQKLSSLGLNVSKTINDYLWTLVKDTGKPNIDLDAEVARLNNMKADLEMKAKVMEKEQAVKDKMVEDGITDEMLLFLRAIDPRKGGVRTWVNAWNAKFDTNIEWLELKALKEKYK